MEIKVVRVGLYLMFFVPLFPNDLAVYIVYYALFSVLFDVLNIQHVKMIISQTIDKIDR